MRTIILSTALMLALPLAAQVAKSAPPPPPPPPTASAAPVIPDSVLKDFFKAQGLMMVASEQAKTSSEKLQAIVANMQKICGPKATLQASPSGDPVCILTTPEKK